MSKLEGPDILNPKPTGIQTVKKSPLILAVFCFTVVLVFLIFKMAAKQQALKEQQKEKSHQSVPFDVASKDMWFEDSKYDNIRRRITEGNSKEKADSEKGVKRDSAITNPDLPDISADTNEKREEDLRKEETRSEIEIHRLNAQAKIEAQRQYLEAIKSPGISTSMSGFNSHLPNQESNASQNSGRNLANSDAENGVLAYNSAASIQSQADPNLQDSKQKFLNQRAAFESNYLPNVKQPPISRYEVKAGAVIPAAIMQGINSDLPGYVTALVRENVYDSVSGRYLLIPQGAKLIGQYDSKLSFGQNRLLIIWTRLIFLDGSSLDLQKMQGVDMSGYAGFKDIVDHHYLRIYGNALLLSLIGAGYETLDPSANRSDTSQTVAGNIGRELAQTTSQITQKNINIQPTIMIRPGYKFNVFVMKDMILGNLNNDGITKK